MGCAASVPDEDKKNKKNKGKEPAAEAAKSTELTTVEKPAEGEKTKEAPKVEEAKPAESAPPAAEASKPAEPEKPKEEPKPEEKKEEVKQEEAKVEEPVKTEEVKVEPKDEAPKSEEPKVETSTEVTAPRKAKIAVVYYSTYGHIAQLAEQVAEGVKKTGAQVEIYQIRETLPEEILEKMHAPPKASHPTIELAATLTEYDGFLFGIPTRFGVWPAQWKTFLDSTGQLWQAGAIHGKYGGIFTSTASQHGGVETTAFNGLTFFAHHGVNFVPFGYAKAFGQLTTLTEIVGASPYGAGTIAGGDGSRQPSDLEKEICQIHGETFAQVVSKQFA